MEGDYKKALERARQAIIDCGSNAGRKEMIYGIFPELREWGETEVADEKIRKAIINVFATHKDYEIFFGVSVEDILAYLEKQKPAEWREEDEGLIDLAVAAVEDFYDKKNPIRVEIIKFLKFLRPQPKQEWSEEDEDRMNSIVNWLAANGSKKFSGFKAFELLDWIKSLRSKPHWKPSEEQMWALDVALENSYHKDDRAALESLRTDLKKLI